MSQRTGGTGKAPIAARRLVDVLVVGSIELPTSD
jgi:hypothetical protein